MTIPFLHPFSDVEIPPTGRFYRKYTEPAGIPLLAILVPMVLTYPDGEDTKTLDCIVHTRMMGYLKREFRLTIVEYAEVVRGSHGSRTLGPALPSHSFLTDMMEAWLRKLKDTIICDLGEEMDEVMK